MTMRKLDLDGAALYFDRDNGENLLVRSEQTRNSFQVAPRVVQMSLTNACNKTCGFCYRPLESKSRWTQHTVLEFARFLSDWGVLELALGGGEPTVFPKFPQLVSTLWEQTELAINFTTNGTLLTDELLEKIQGSVGQIQVSVYDDEDLDSAICMLNKYGIRFGLNYLVTPRRLRTLDADLLSWSTRGVRDVLLLSYKGFEQTHLNPVELTDLESRISNCRAILGDRLQIKLDVCWSSRLPNTPQLFYEDDCGAGQLFMSITSDKKVLSCSFADGGIAFDSFDELPHIYNTIRNEKRPALKPGCARLPQFGLDTTLEPVTDYPEIRR